VQSATQTAQSAPGQATSLGSSPYSNAPEGSAGHVSQSPYSKEGTAGQAASLITSAPAPSAASGDFVSRKSKNDNAQSVPPLPSRSAAPAGGEPIAKTISAPGTMPQPVPSLPKTNDVKANSLPANKRTPAPTREPAADEVTVMLSKPDGSPMKCIVLSEAVRADGSRVSQVKVVETGEILTMVEEGKSPPRLVGRPSPLSDKSHSAASPTVAERGKPVTMESDAQLQADMSTKTSFVQRVKDRLHGDRANSEMPRETVIASTKV